MGYLSQMCASFAQLCISRYHSTAHTSHGHCLSLTATLRADCWMGAVLSERNGRALLHLYITAGKSKINQAPKLALLVCLMR